MTAKDDDTAGDLATEVGARIRALREARGLSLQDLVDQGGASSKAHMSLTERGLTQPTLASLARIAACLQVPVHDLLPVGAPDRKRIVARVRALDDATLRQLESFLDLLERKP